MAQQTGGIGEPHADTGIIGLDIPADGRADGKQAGEIILQSAGMRYS